MQLKAIKCKIESINKYLLRGFLSAVLVGSLFVLYCQQTGKFLPIVHAQEKAVNPELKTAA